jgi:hypothetical protein
MFACGDSDEGFADQQRAVALRKRLEANGIETTVLLPSKIGTDWLDVLNEFGVEGFPILSKQSG